MRNYKATDVTSYIGSCDPQAQPKLNELRQLILSTIPGIEEGISWGVPFYRYHGLLAGFAVFKNHVTFGLVDVFDEKDRKTLEKEGYKTGKKTVQIGFDQKIPIDFIYNLIKTKAKINKDKVLLKEKKKYGTKN